MPTQQHIFKPYQHLPLLFACAMGALSASAHADPTKNTTQTTTQTTKNPPGEFEKIIMQASEHAKNNEAPEAILLWEKAYAQRPEPWVACAVAQVYLRIERKLEAARWFNTCKRTVDLPQSEEGFQRRGKELLEFEIAKAHLVELEIEADEGASIFVNGEAQGLAPLRFPLFSVPGKVKIEARKDQQIIKREIEGERAQSISISLVSPPFIEPALITESMPAPYTNNKIPLLSSALRPSPPVLPVQDRRSAWERAQPWVVGANLALAGTAAGLGIWLRYKVTNAQNDETTYLANGVLALGADDVDRAKNEVQKAVDENQRAILFHQLSIACFVASGVFGASGITAFFIKGTKSQPTSIGLTGRFTW